MDARITTNASNPGVGIELDDLNPTEGGARGITTHGNPTTLDTQTPGPLHQAEPPHPPVDRGALHTWWSANIAITINHDPDGGHSNNNDFRDYLALERTYMAHVRTGMALASFGVVLLQLFRLREMNPRAGVALGAVCAGGGAIIVLLGARHYFVLQKKLIRGKTATGGSIIWMDAMIILAILTAVLAVILAN
ncbi:MAG: hypothetical protein LQ346_007008 [Caloplaca aetnensis]|nr:MAG: hypothetical protein LQ346_007008 [Caloplaca aetnensis]